MDKNIKSEPIVVKEFENDAELHGWLENKNAMVNLRTKCIKRYGKHIAKLDMKNKQVIIQIVR